MQANSRPRLPGPLDRLPVGVKAGMGVVAPLVPGLGPLASPGGQIGQVVAEHAMDNPIGKALMGALLAGVGQAGRSDAGQVMGEKMPVLAMLGKLGYGAAAQQAAQFDAGPEANAYDRARAANEAGARHHEFAVGLGDNALDPINFLGPASKLAELAKLGKLARVLAVADQAQNLPGEVFGKGVGAVARKAAGTEAGQAALRKGAEVAPPKIADLLGGLANRAAAREALTTVGEKATGKLGGVAGVRQYGPDELLSGMVTPDLITELRHAATYSDDPAVASKARQHLDLIANREGRQSPPPLGALPPVWPPAPPRAQLADIPIMPPPPGTPFKAKQPVSDLLGAAQGTAKPSLAELLRDAGARSAAREVAPALPKRSIAAIEAAVPKAAGQLPLTEARPLARPAELFPPEAVTPGQERAARLANEGPLGDLLPQTAAPDFVGYEGIPRSQALALLSTDDVDNLVNLAYPVEKAQANAINLHQDPAELADAALARIQAPGPEGRRLVARLQQLHPDLAEKVAFLPDPAEALPNVDLPPAITDPADRAAWQAKYVGQSQAGTDILAAGDKVAGGDLTQADLNALSPQERMAALRKLAAEPAPSVIDEFDRPSTPEEIAAYESSLYPPGYHEVGALIQQQPSFGKLRAAIARLSSKGGGAPPTDPIGYLNHSPWGADKQQLARLNALQEAVGTEAGLPRQVDDLRGFLVDWANLPPTLGGKPKPALGGDIAAGGGGMGIVPARLGTTTVGAALGGVAGAGIGAATDEDDRLGGAARGAAIGTLAGGNLGAVSPEIGRAAQEIASTVGAKYGDTALDPSFWADAARVGWDEFQKVRATAGVRGPKEAFDAFWAQWRSQVVNTLKQVPQDATTRKFVQEGIARQEFGLTDGDIRAFQGVLRQERLNGTSGLDNPLTARLRALGAEGVLGDMQSVYGVDFGTDVAQQAGKQFGGLGRTLAGAGIGLASGAKTVNPISPLYGAARGYAAPFVDGMIRYINGIQHDAFRYALATKALDRDLPELASKFLAELGGRGVDVSRLAGHAGYFSPEEVAAVAGQQAGKDWQALTEATIRKQGDRIAFLAGDFRKGSETAVERNLSKAVPFARWSIRYAPVFAEIAARHPVATVYALRELNREQEQAKAAGKKAYQSGLTVSTETPVLGGLARARLGGQRGEVTLDPLGMLIPYADAGAGGEPLPDDATGYQRLTDLGGRAGFQPNPLIQSLAYVTGQDYKAPGALSRTAGLEGLSDTLPILARAGLRWQGLPGLANQVPDAPQIPSGRAALDQARKIITGSGGSDNTPEARRYAELVLAQTKKPLTDPSNRGYLETMGQSDNPLWQLAILQARAGAAAGNATGLVSPVQTTAQTTQARAAQAAGPLPFTSYDISQAPKAQRPAMELANRRALQANPASGTYVNITGRGREEALIAQWEAAHAGLLRFSPTTYAQRLKEYKASLK